MRGLHFGDTSIGSLSRGAGVICAALDTDPVKRCDTRLEFFDEAIIELTFLRTSPPAPRGRAPGAAPPKSGAAAS